MGELKFKAWDKKNKKWLHDFLISQNGLNVYVGNNNDWVDAELVQFTGLLDKNGKETYEDDYIKSKGNIYRVVSGGYEFRLLRVKQFNGIRFTKRFHELQEDFEIVGNFYETLR